MTTSDDPTEDGLTPAQRPELESMIANLTTEVDAYAALGRSLGATATGEDPEEQGRAVFERRKGEVVRLVCGNGQVRAYCSAPNTADATTIAAAVAGALVAGKLAGINIVLVTCLVVRIGLRNLCAAAWTSAD